MTARLGGQAAARATSRITLARPLSARAGRPRTSPQCVRSSVATRRGMSPVRCSASTADATPRSPVRRILTPEFYERASGGVPSGHGSTSVGSKQIRATAATSPRRSPSPRPRSSSSETSRDGGRALPQPLPASRQQTRVDRFPVRRDERNDPRVLVSVPRVAIRPPGCAARSCNRSRVLRLRQGRPLVESRPLRGLGRLHLRQPG